MKCEPLHVFTVVSAIFNVIAVALLLWQARQHARDMNSAMIRELEDNRL